MVLVRQIYLLVSYSITRIYIPPAKWFHVCSEVNISQDS
jgi:hypothetical protein